MATLVQIPDMNLVAVLSSQQQFGVGAVFHHVRRAPFGRNHRVVPQVPPEVVSQLLRATILFPRTLQLECVRIHQENAAGAVSASGSECASVNAIWSAMNCVRRGVSSLPDELFGLDHLHNLRLPRVRLRIEDVDPRGSDSRYDQVAALHMRMRGLRTKARAACVPAKVV